MWSRICGAPCALLADSPVRGLVRRGCPSCCRGTAHPVHVTGPSGSASAHSQAPLRVGAKHGLPRNPFVDSQLVTVTSLPERFDRSTIHAATGNVKIFNGFPANGMTTRPDRLRRLPAAFEPLSDSEAAWADRTLANVLACSEHAAEAVAVHEAFECWLPGTSPSLSVNYPLVSGPKVHRNCPWGADEIRLEFLKPVLSSLRPRTGAVGRHADYVAKFDGSAPAQRHRRTRTSSSASPRWESRSMPRTLPATSSEPAASPSPSCARSRTRSQTRTARRGCTAGRRPWEINWRAHGTTRRAAPRSPEEALSLLDRLEKEWHRQQMRSNEASDTTWLTI